MDDHQFQQSELMMGSTDAAGVSLYDCCIHSFVKQMSPYNSLGTFRQVQYVRYLPPGVLIDIYTLMLQRMDLQDVLFEELSDLEVFERLLRFHAARKRLLRCLATVISRGKPLAKQLQENFEQRYKIIENSKVPFNTAYRLATLAKAKLGLLRRCSSTNCNSNSNHEININISNFTWSTSLPSPLNSGQKTESMANDKTNISNDHCDELPLVSKSINQLEGHNNGEIYSDFRPEAIDFGMRLGSFLSEAGWFTESVEILTIVANKQKTNNYLDYSNPKAQCIRLDCLQRLLHSETTLSKFKSAENTFNQITNILKAMPSTEYVPKPLLANIYTQFSEMYFARNEYDYSHMWSAVAIRHLNEETHERIVIDVLRQAGKTCVVKRYYQRANMLICQAKQRARKTFGQDHQKYADTLLDYGFFLLNVDSPHQSVCVYKEALDIKRSIFGNRNFHVAVAHEDLSYAYYVHEYTTGNFTCARDHVEKAVDILKDLVPSNHLKLATTKRVKALLLEEIALDKMADGSDDEGLLKQSEELHKFALKLSLEVFGEINVQTAKLYGNLGRLYQTMNRFEEAERMHQKAIEIKTDLLGPYDYEVGLSIGHLASLYNYQMKKYREAEELYLRSIEISLRLFGSSYSGLEYDYLGLCHVYETLREYGKYLVYAHILENWQTLRSQNISMNKSIYPVISKEISLEEIKWQFFNTIKSVPMD